MLREGATWLKSATSWRLFFVFSDVLFDFPHFPNQIHFKYFNFSLCHRYLHLEEFVKLVEVCFNVHENYPRCIGMN